MGFLVKVEYHQFSMGFVKVCRKRLQHGSFKVLVSDIEGYRTTNEFKEVKIAFT